MDSSALAFYSLVACALAAIAWLLAQPLWRRWRRARLQQRPFPPEWRAILRRRVPLYARLPPDLQQRLLRDMRVFIAEKPFLGCAGLEVSEEMRVVVAALACVPLLGDARGYYPQLQRVLMYPDAFKVPHHEVGEDGVHSAWKQELIGQSWAEGQVLLSWPDVQDSAADPHDGFNVVIHEFAHQLDQTKGFANGAPEQASRQAYRRWSAALQAEYDALCARVDAGDEDGLIDPYAANDPAEFFAVCSELFFECGEALHAEHPRLFEALHGYYRVNPRLWA